MLGKVQREILWAAFCAENWALVNEPGSSKYEITTRMSAVKKLVEWGLLELGQVRDYRLFPACRRAAVRTSALGNAFCQTYATALSKNRRIRAKIFEDATGFRGGWARPPGHGAHLHNHKAA